MLKLNTLFLAGFTVAAFGVAVLDARAQGSAGISISPTIFELSADPGDTIQNTLKLSNPTQNTVTIQFVVEDFTTSGEEGRVVIEPAETFTHSLATWVTTDPAFVTLQPREAKKIEFTIVVPENAEPGGHYGSILATITASEGNEGFSGTAISQKVGSLVLITVSGAVREVLDIEEFVGPSFLEYGPVAFTIRFENKGSVHVRPRGFVTITDWRDKKVIDLELPQKNILPGSARKIDVVWDAKWLFGKYKAMIVGSYGSSNEPFPPHIISFWVFPWKIAGAAGFAALLVLTFFFFTRKRWIRAFKILLRGEKY